MKFKSLLWFCVGAIVLVAGATWAFQIATLGKVMVQSVSDPHPKLTVGGPDVTVRVTGQQLGAATSCAVLLNGVVVQDISVSLGPATPTCRDATLKANPNLTKSVNGYRIRIMAGSQALDVPPDIFVMDVVVPARLTPLGPARPARPEVGPPNVDTTRLSNRGRTGSEIVFWGRDFVPDRFVAMIGSTPLTVTYRTASEIRAVLPGQRMSGPLVASHGTENSKVLLRPSFEVYAHPVIYTILPFSFKRGDWVDLAGLDLDHAGPITYTTSVHNPWVMIEDVPSESGRKTLIVADSWSVAADGSSARFRAGDPYDPQVTTLTGKLRLYDEYDRAFDVASRISITWNKGPALVINAVYPEQKWNSQNVDFILLKDSTSSNYLIVEGFGILPETRAKMGNVDLVTREGSGTRGAFSIPYNATTNYVQFVCAGTTAQSAAPLRVGIWPKWDPATYSSMGNRMKIVLNTEYALRGWGLKPTGIVGMVYTLDFNFLPGRPLQVQILEHTDSLIRFKVVTTAPLPANYMEFREFSSTGLNQFLLNGRYQGGTPIVLLSQLYYLATQ
jgi:hypothetical protein